MGAWQSMLAQGRLQLTFWGNLVRSGLCSSASLSWHFNDISSHSMIIDMKAINQLEINHRLSAKTLGYKTSLR